MAELKNIRIAVSGIYDYAYEELPSLRVPFPGSGAPQWTEKKDIYKVYRPANVLAAACDKFKLLPLTHHHPQCPVDGQNFRDLAIGYTGENPFVDYLKDKDEVGIRSNVMFMDDEAFYAYENGERQLSPGYLAEFHWSQGTSPKGEPYDIIMTEITDVNHLALLPAGRGGEDAVVMDKAPKVQTVFDLVRLAKDTKYNPGDISKKTGLQKQEDGTWREPAEKSKGPAPKKTNDEWRKELKAELQSSMHKELPNKATGITAQLAMEGFNKMTSGVAIKKSVDNGFSGDQHFEAVRRIAELFEKAKLIKTHSDEKHGQSYVKINRFVAQDTMDDGTPFDALITVKETTEHGHRIYSLELEEINKASLRWQVNDDGTLSQQESTTGSLKSNITKDTNNVKQTDCYMSIFDRVKGTVFDLYR